MDFKTAAIEEIKAFAIDQGYSIASYQNAPNIGDEVSKEIDWQGIGAIESVQDIIDALQMMSVNAEEGFRSYTPFELWAHGMNERKDSEEVWEAYDEGIQEGIDKNLEERREAIVEHVLSTECNDLGIDVPAWIDQDVELIDVQTIQQGGCASGAYMPAVAYYQAMETMHEHGDDVLDYIQDTLGELPALPDDVSWSGIAVHYLSYAVELWAGSIELEEYGIEN